MKIAVTGSIAFDYLMRFPGRFSEQLLADELHQISVSFLVDEMTRHWGGVAANIAYTMALLGLEPFLMGTVGRDFGEYQQRLERVGVRCDGVRWHNDVFTASFFANTDQDNNQIASFYAGAMALAKGYRLSDAFDFNPDLVVISPNDPAAMAQIAQECRERDIRFIYDPSQQVARLNGEELYRDMQGAYVMIVNSYEFEVISQKTGKTLDDLKHDIEVIVVTHGKRGSRIHTRDNSLDVPVFPQHSIADPTGVGDAYRAGFIYGVTAGWSLELAGQVGSLCATYVLEQVGTQNHTFTIEEFVHRFRTIYDDRGALDELINRQTSSK